MVKIFIGNLASDTSPQELRELFQKYGQVSQCDILKNYGFVHMDTLSEAEEAIKNLHQLELNGWRMNVELSKGRPKSTTKIHVSNLSGDVTREDLRAKFEEFGPVAECDIVKDYAFVHMEQVEDAMNAINMMDNTAFKGKLLSVQLSTSRLRTAPGMGSHSGCFVCGKHGHWSKDCVAAGRSNRGGVTRAGADFQRGHPGFGTGGPMSAYVADSMYYGSSYAGGLPPAGSEQPDAYGGRAAERASPYDRYHPYSGADYYGRYRGQPYGSSQFEDRRLSHVAPASHPAAPLSNLASVDTYEHAAPLPPVGYYGREYSAMAQAAARSGYERDLSPAAGRSAYQAPPSKDPYAQHYAPDSNQMG